MTGRRLVRGALLLCTAAAGRASAQASRPIAELGAFLDQGATVPA